MQPAKGTGWLTLRPVYLNQFCVHVSPQLTSVEIGLTANTVCDGGDGVTVGKGHWPGLASTPPPSCKSQLVVRAAEPRRAGLLMGCDADRIAIKDQLEFYKFDKVWQKLL